MEKGEPIIDKASVAVVVNDPAFNEQVEETLVDLVSKAVNIPRPGHGGHPAKGPLQPAAGGDPHPGYRDHPGDTGRLRPHGEGFGHAHRVCGQALKRTITHRFTEAGQLKVISLDANIENQIMGAVKKVETGSYLALEPKLIQEIINATTRELGKVKDPVSIPIILTSPIIRLYFKKLVDQFYLNAVVLSFNEIDSDVKIQALGSITLS